MSMLGVDVSDIGWICQWSYVYRKTL